MPRTLTAKNVKTLPAPAPGSKTRQLDYWDAIEEGLGLRVSATHRGWVVRYRVDGRRRRLALDSIDRMSLADARERAGQIVRKAKDGIDAAAQKRERREAGTFGELAAEYMKRHANPAGDPTSTDDSPAAAPAVPDAVTTPTTKRRAKGKKSWKEDRRIINNVLLAKTGADWEHRKATDIERGDVQDLFDAITDRGAPVQANRVVALASKVFNFGLTRGWVKSNPAHRIEKNDEESRARVLADDEVRELWAALAETEHVDDQGRPCARLNATLNDAFRALFYTMQRGVEVFTMRWADVDLLDGWWEIPGKYTKNGVIHRVPLSVLGVELLARRLQIARPGALWVFENVQPTKKANRHFGNVRYRGKKAAGFLSRGDAHLRNKRARSRKRAAFLPGLSFAFQAHDIRRTASTNSTKAGVRREDVSKLLNHIDRGPRATRVYDRYEYDAEKRAAMEVWARKLDAILNRQSAHVVEFAQVAR